LRLKKIPSGFVPLQHSGVPLFQFFRPLLVRINSRFVLDPSCKCLQPSRPHAFFFSEDRGALDVDRAPNAASASRRESDFVADLVYALPDSVDPAKTKRFIHRFRPCDARPPGIFSIKPHPKFPRRGVVFVEPPPKIQRRSEKSGLQPICFLYAAASFKFLRSSALSILRTKSQPCPNGSRLIKPGSASSALFTSTTVPLTGA
jgi:hypothetical protein